MHCRRPKGAHRQALCLAMHAQPVGSNSEHLIWQNHLLFARRGPRCAAALMVSAAILSGCSLASSVGSSDGSPSFASRFASFSFFSDATPGVAQPHSPTPSAPEAERLDRQRLFGRNDSGLQWGSRVHGCCLQFFTTF